MEMDVRPLAWSRTDLPAPLPTPREATAQQYVGTLWCLVPRSVMMATIQREMVAPPLVPFKQGTTAQANRQSVSPFAEIPLFLAHRPVMTEILWMETAALLLV